MPALNCHLQLRKTSYWINLKKKKESISLEENKLRYLNLDFSCSKVLPLHI